MVDTSMVIPADGRHGTSCGKRTRRGPFPLKQGYTADQVDALLNKQNGLQGVRPSSDMRDMSGRAAATRMPRRYTFRPPLLCYIGSYICSWARRSRRLTGGIGEIPVRSPAGGGADAVYGCSLNAEANNSAPSRYDQHARSRLRGGDADQ